MNKFFKSKFLSDPQNIIAVSVTIISLCALIVSIMQMNLLREERELMREHARASVWPHLELMPEQSFNKDHTLKSFRLKLTNTGVGPAIITDVLISWNDSIAHNWWELFELMKVSDSIERGINNSYFNKRVMKIGESVNILDFDNNIPLANAFVEKINNKENNIHLEIFYKSIYNDRWKYFQGKSVKISDYKSLPKDKQFH